MRTRNLITATSVKRLTDLAVSTMFYMCAPSTQLKNMSMLIHPKPYIERALKLTAVRKTTRAQTAAMQKFTCVICKKSLIEFNKFGVWSSLSQELVYSARILQGKAKKRVSSENLLSKRHDTQLDYMIPKILMTDNCKFFFFKANSYKSIVHTHCHRLKAFINQKFLLKK